MVGNKEIDNDKLEEEIHKQDLRLEMALNAVAYMLGTRTRMLLAEENKPEEEQDKGKMADLKKTLTILVQEQHLINRLDEPSIDKALTTYSKIQVDEIRKYREENNALSRK